MHEKVIKIQMDNETIEYKVKENQTLILEVKNENNDLKVTKNEYIDSTSNHYDNNHFKDTNTDIYKRDYDFKEHKSSIFDVLNNSLDKESNGVSNDDNFEKEEQIKSIDDKYINTDNEETVEVFEQEEQDALSENVDETQEDDELSDYNKLLSEVIKNLNGKDKQESNS